MSGKSDRRCCVPILSIWIVGGNEDAHLFCTLIVAVVYCDVFPIVFVTCYTRKFI